MEGLNIMGSPLWSLMLSRPLVAEGSRAWALDLVEVAVVVEVEVEEAVQVVAVGVRQVLEIGDRAVKGKIRCFPHLHPHMHEWKSQLLVKTRSRRWAMHCLVQTGGRV